MSRKHIYNGFVFPDEILYPTNHKYNIDGNAVRSEASLLLRQDTHPLAILTEAASSTLQPYFAGVRLPGCTTSGIPL